MRRQCQLALAAALWLGLVATPARAQSGEPGSRDGATGDAALATLMQRFASSGGVRARFRETKRLALLEAPLETEGLVVFAPPDRLVRHTTKPGSSSVVVDGRRVLIRDETGVQHLELGEDDVARQLVDNLSVLLRGDLAALRSRYSVRSHFEDGAWRLELKPRSALLSRVVESIRVEGRGAALERMEVRETNGDSTVTLFFDVETGLSFEPGELERVFSAPDPS